VRYWLSVEAAEWEIAAAIKLNSIFSSVKQGKCARQNVSDQEITPLKRSKTPLSPSICYMKT
jgi:hypothetical protein